MPDLVKHSVHEHTNFLNYDAPIITRVSYLLNEQKQQLICKKCSEYLKIKRTIETSSKYCSIKCSHSSIESLEKRKKTNLEKFGVDNPFKSEIIKQKVKEVFVDRYGVDNISKSPHVKQVISEKNKKNSLDRVSKSKETMIKKYGKHISQLQEVKEKKKKTSILNYGVEHYSKSKKFKEQFKETCKNRYGVPNPAKSVTVKEKIKISKLEKYGDPNFNNSKKTQKTMKEKYGHHFSKNHWDQKTLTLMNSPEALIEFVKDKTINEISNELGIASTTVRNNLHRLGIFDYSQRKNQYESIIENHLKKLQLDYIKNDRSILNGKEIDFLIPELKIGIECNGMFWHSELMGKGKTYHLSKTDLAQKQGVQLIHLWDFQFDQNTSLIQSMITHMAGKSEHRVMGRKTKIVNLSPFQYREFLKQNHIQRSVNSPFRYGLVFENECVAVMGFGKSRFSRKEMELQRFACKKNFSVVGGASRMLSHFLKQNPDVEKITSYASRDYSFGKLYQVLGFVPKSITPPNYFYFDNRTVYNRMKFQKHKLPTILKNYNPMLSEWENMKNHGYNRFWDTGNIKYEFIR